MPAAEFNFIDDHRLEAGATFRRTLTLYQGGPAGSKIGQVTALPEADRYDVLASDGTEFCAIGSEASKAVGDWVYVAEDAGAWAITGAAQPEDLSGVESAHMQVRTNAGGTVVGDWSTTDDTLAITAAEGKIQIEVPWMSTAAIAARDDYRYDLFLLYADNFRRRLLCGTIQVEAAITVEPEPEEEEEP